MGSMDPCRGRHAAGKWHLGALRGRLVLIATANSADIEGVPEVTSKSGQPHERALSPTRSVKEISKDDKVG